ncbi:hypothetical protein EGR_10225 [Echinococcus granulosus]|uniref:Uncharacterized protein n=1 Tax=Echinococcus granulosus TaxID=6210 RepID=W6U1D0_ECHGR|nr:hypothetical protein EGR_10225 [Echinococcus granulosus]EUB54915.1 hypothetical protein EGR_10225 [Echinococcus granulosus]
MENWTSKEETSTGSCYTPLYYEADYPDLMRNDQWTRVNWNETSEVNATVPYAAVNDASLASGSTTVGQPGNTICASPGMPNQHIYYKCLSN